VSNEEKKATEIFGKWWVTEKTDDVPHHVVHEVLRHDIENGYFLSMFELGEFFGDVGGKAYQIALCREIETVKEIDVGDGKKISSKLTVREMSSEPIWDRFIKTVDKEVDGETVKVDVTSPEYIARIYARDLDGFNGVYANCQKIASIKT